MVPIHPARARSVASLARSSYSERGGMARRRRSEIDGQQELDLWALSEPAADERADAARRDHPTPEEVAYAQQGSLFGDQPGSDQDEQVRPPGQGSLDAVRPDPVRSTGGPGGVLHEPGGAGGHSGGPDQPAHGGGTIGGPALPGEGGTDERDPQPGRGSGDGGPGVLGGDGALQPGRGTAGDAERSLQPGPYSRPDRPHLRPSRGDGRGGDGPEPELAGEAGVPDAATSPDRGSRPGEDERAGDPRPDPPAAGPAAPAVATGAAFRPESQDDLAPSGQVARFRANVAAIEVVQALGEDDRQATAEEQQILARWSSWGAIPQVFD